jgi:hypothetical protein
MSRGDTMKRVEVYIRADDVYVRKLRLAHYKFRPPDIADFPDWKHGAFCVRGADQYLSGFSGPSMATG